MADPQPISKPQVVLNHFCVVLDSTTCKAVEQDVFLRRQFAVNEKRTTTNAEMSYTGLCFYGVNTYFEFFDVASSETPRLRSEWCASPKLGAHLKSTTSKEDPALWRKGHDPQLEEGVEVALLELKGHPTPQIKRPQYPVYNWQKVRADASKGQSSSSRGGSGQDR